MQPHCIVPTVEALRTYVERAKTRRPELTSRLERAAFIVMLRQIERRGPDEWLVESDTERGKFYVVSGIFCSCYDHSRAPSGLCKHRLAVGTIQIAERDAKASHRERVSDERIAVNFGLAFAGALS